MSHMPSMSNPIFLDDPLGLDPYPHCGQTADDAMCRAVFFKPNPSCKTTFQQCLDSCVSTLNSWWTVPAGGAAGFGRSLRGLE